MDTKEFTTVQVQGISAETLLQKFSSLENQIKELKNEPQQRTEKLLTRFDVADLLGISLVTVHNWNKAKILNPFRIGNKVRYKESEVLNALKSINSTKAE